MSLELNETERQKLLELISSKEFDLYFGKTFQRRAAVLAWWFGNGETSLQQIANQMGCKRQALTQYAAECRDIFSAQWPQGNLAGV